MISTLSLWGRQKYLDLAIILSSLFIDYYVSGLLFLSPIAISTYPLLEVMEQLISSNMYWRWLRKFKLLWEISSLRKKWKD